MAPKSKASAKKKAVSAQLKHKWSKEAERLTKQVLREHPSLKSLSDTQVHGTVVSKKSLYQALLHDKYLAQSGAPNAPAFGSNYYRAMAQKYAGSQRTATGILSVSAGGDAAAAIDEALVDALCGWEDTPRRPALLMDWLTISEKELFIYIYIYI